MKYLARGSGYGILLTDDAAVLTLRKSQEAARNQRGPRSSETVLTMALVGANRHAKVEGVDELPGRTNYFIGRDPSRWRTGVPTYARVAYREVYPGIDLVYYGNQGQLEYDFVLAPGADPRRIALDVEGQVEARVDARGDLNLGFGDGAVTFHAPAVYQTPSASGSRTRVEGHYRLRDHQVTFELGAYDTRRPLVIDPTLTYSTYLGGTKDDFGAAIAVGREGNTYIVGQTSSVDFPIAGAEQSTCASCSATAPTADAFVTKLNASGTALIYSTYLGGNSGDAANSVAVDADGNAYVAGSTLSTDFPAVNAFRDTFGGVQDAFVVKVDTSGSKLDYSTYLGGGQTDSGFAIAVDGSGNAYVSGQTSSTDFPLMDAAQSTLGGGFDAFVTKFSTDGTSLVYSTYLGGSLEDDGFGIAVDAAGNAYVTGQTLSNNFPTANAFQSAFHGIADAFLTKLSFSNSKLTMAYSTYLGGSSSDEGLAIALDSSGNVYLTGLTSSTDFPTLGALQPVYGGGTEDAFVTKVKSDGSGLVYSTYLGGTMAESGRGIAVDSAGRAHVTGFTTSTNFPITNAVQSSNRGNQDAFVARVNPMGCGLVFSTYLGGSALDTADGIAVDSSGNTYVTGSTFSNDFPTQSPFQAATAGQNDAWAAKLAAFTASSVCLSPTSLTFSPENVTTTSAAQTITLTNGGDADLNVTSITSSGDYSQTNTCGTSVAAGANCTINVTFSPVGSGTRNGTITITDDAGNSPQTVPLTGIGNDFGMTVTPGLDTVTQGQPATYTLTIAPTTSLASTIALSCSGAPAPGNCTINPASVTFSGSGANSNQTATVTVTTVAPSSLLPPSRPPSLPPFSSLARWIVILLGPGALAFYALRRRKPPAITARWILAGATAALFSLLALACGSTLVNNGTPTSTTPGNYTITLTGTAGTLTHSVSTRLTVTAKSGG